MSSTDHLIKEITLLRETNRDLSDRLAALRVECTHFELEGMDSVHMTPKHRTLLKILHDHGGKVVSKDRLFYALYAAHYSDRDMPEPKIIDVFICKMRQALKGSQWNIVTEYGVGYALKRRVAS